MLNIAISHYLNMLQSLYPISPQWGVMPFTPFHMGPGIAIKAISGRYFSVLVFGIVQVAMDLEPFVAMTRGTKVLHGITHTYLGATLIAIVVLFLSPPVCRIILKRWNQELEHYGFGWLCSPESLGWFPAAMGAFVGAYSHVALDSVMHTDIRPMWPFSDTNGLLAFLSIDLLHWWCFISGVIGVGGWFFWALIRRKRIEDLETISKFWIRPNNKAE